MCIRDSFHADHGIGNQVDAENNVDDSDVYKRQVFSIAWALGIGTFILGAGMGSAGGSVFGLLIGLAALVASMWFSLAQGCLLYTSRCV